MNKNTKKVVLGCLTLVVIGAAMTGCSWFDKEKNPAGNDVSDNNQVTEQINNDEFIKYEENGTRVNVSPNIVNSTKKLGTLEFRNINISEVVNMTKITADVYNTSTEDIIEKDLVIKLLDKNNKVIIEIPASLGTIKAGESTRMISQTTLDYANAYDVQFVEKSVE